MSGLLTLGRIMLLAGACLLAFAGVHFNRFKSDSALIRQTAQEVLGADAQTDSAAVEKLTNWVYGNQGFAKNRRYYILRRLGPTPVQVLDSGGDCSDKSRLLSAMLFELGIPNTLVMLYSDNFERSTHTIVETRLPGLQAAADPVFDVVFPDGKGGLLGVSQLRDHHDLFVQRIASLAAERGPRSKISFYETETESYRWPRTINWHKSASTRAVRKLLAPFVPDPDLMKRPRILEEPVMAMTAASLSGGALLIALGIALLRESKRRRMLHTRADHL